MNQDSSRLRIAAVLVGLLGLIAGLHFAGYFVDADLTFSDPVGVVATVARWVALMLSYYLFGIVVVTAFLGDQIHESRWASFAPASVVAMASVLIGTAVVAAPIVIDVREPVPDVGLILQELEEPIVLTEAMISLPPIASSDSVTPQSHLVDAATVEWWVVEPGESFWSIAEEHLQDELGRSELSDEEITSYWRVLIDANIQRMKDPGNPDLILPGQEFVLPNVQS